MGLDEIATLFRGLERISIVSAAILAMYFGYKLFLAGIDTDQSGEFTSKNFSLKLIKVGPGVFFALFSTSVLISMTWQNIQFYGSGAADLNNSGSRLSSFFGAKGSGELRRQLEVLTLMKSRFQSEEISKEVFLSSVGSLQKLVAKMYVGDDVFESCEFGSENSDTIDCQTYLELIK